MLSNTDVMHSYNWIQSDCLVNMHILYKITTHALSLLNFRNINIYTTDEYFHYSSKRYSMYKYICRYIYMQIYLLIHFLLAFLLKNTVIQSHIYLQSFSLRCKYIIFVCDYIFNFSLENVISNLKIKSLIWFFSK